MTRILIADDHEIVRPGLRSILETWSGWDVVAEATDGEEAIVKAVETKPDVAVVDYSLPLINGIEVTRQIRRRLPSTEIQPRPSAQRRRSRVEGTGGEASRRSASGLEGVASGTVSMPRNGHARSNRDARIEIKHVLVVETDAALRDRLTDGPGCIRSMNAIHARTEIQRAHAQWILRVPARHVHGKPWVLAAHLRRWCPAGVDALVGNRRHALPAAFVARYRDRVADGLTAAMDKIEPLVAEADNDLPRCVGWMERNHLARAAAPEQRQEPLRRGGLAGNQQ